jgi:hypothetical protein
MKGIVGEEVQVSLNLIFQTRTQTKMCKERQTYFFKTNFTRTLISFAMLDKAHTGKMICSPRRYILSVSSAQLYKGRVVQP